MFSVSNSGNGYAIKLSGSRKEYKAANLQEVITALYHYHIQPEHGPTLRRDDCPLCRGTAFCKGEERK